MSSPSLVKIAFTGDDGEVENLWAFDLGNGQFKLDSTPWYQYGVSYQDVVAASLRDERLQFDRIISKSGFRTLRVRSQQPVPRQLLDSLESIGCKWEGAQPTFIGIDVPAATDLASATTLLIDSGLEWEYGDPTYDQLHGPEA